VKVISSVLATLFIPFGGILLSAFACQSSESCESSVFWVPPAVAIVVMAWVNWRIWRKPRNGQNPADTGGKRSTVSKVIASLVVTYLVGFLSLFLFLGVRCGADWPASPCNPGEHEAAAFTVLGAGLGVIVLANWLIWRRWRTRKQL
jgi:hypothetical protein